MVLNILIVNATFKKLGIQYRSRFFGKSIVFLCRSKKHLIFRSQTFRIALESRRLHTAQGTLAPKFKSLFISALYILKL